ncbi:sigma factor-like helix-turn-helix DNA-binding protein [Neobacillus muris]|uniref:sigma factor-like helix-turn-helix DNA-binding protein n=1 Tax=Neobacillus muris TaxID=2941334 RepID=UPI00204144C5|nr:sigma factor-like helix-turn-helix DNA-binding protein [Neobacillus muris]
MSQEWRRNPIKDRGEFDDPFWRESYPKLRRYCHFLAQNEWDGDDIAQETYLKALKYNNREQKLNSALINKIAYHHWIDQLRKRSKETIESDVSQYAFNSPSEAKADSVELLIRKFTPKQAVIFFLKEAFHYQIKEIAGLLGTTEMAVKANLYRAKKRIGKSNDEDDSFAVETFWVPEEQGILSELFNESLENQDPAVLIAHLPSLSCVTDNPCMITNKHSQVQRFSPSSTLCMAA